MAAGLGFKDFTTGEVLTAADVDGYLMQGVWVFASAAARDAAVTSPQEGNFAYLKDTNVTTYYTGSAWANLDTTGMTNPMTTTGDIIYSSSGSTPARLGIGTAGQVLKVNSGATAPEWSAAASGALTYITTVSPSAVTSQSVNDCFSSTYKNYLIVINVDASAGADGNNFAMRLRVSGSDNSNANYQFFGIDGSSAATTVSGNAQSSTSYFRMGDIGAGGEGNIVMYISNPFASEKTAYVSQSNGTGTSNARYGNYSGNMTVTTSYTGFTVFLGSGDFTGSIRVYGVSNS